MEFIASIKNLIPDYAKDIRLNLDGTIARSSLEGNDAVGVALAADESSGQLAADSEEASVRACIFNSSESAKLYRGAGL